MNRTRPPLGGPGATSTPQCSQCPEWRGSGRSRDVNIRENFCPGPILFPRYSALLRDGLRSNSREDHLQVAEIERSKFEASRGFARQSLAYDWVRQMASSSGIDILPVAVMSWFREPEGHIVIGSPRKLSILSALYPSTRYVSCCMSSTNPTRSDHAVG